MGSGLSTLGSLPIGPVSAEWITPGRAVPGGHVSFRQAGELRVPGESRSAQFGSKLAADGSARRADLTNLVPSCPTGKLGEFVPPGQRAGMRGGTFISMERPPSRRYRHLQRAGTLRVKRSTPVNPPRRLCRCWVSAAARPSLRRRRPIGERRVRAQGLVAGGGIPHLFDNTQRSIVVDKIKRDVYSEAHEIK